MPSKTITLTCPYCGESFTRVPSMVRGGYCGLACAYADRKPEPDVARECLRCHSSFTARAADVRRGKGKYCSVQCHDAAQRGADAPIERVCKQCGESFRLRPYRLTSGGGKYCSKSCAYAGRRDENRRDRDCWAYVQWRKAVLRRDNFTCQMCGFRGKHLHAHHVKAWMAAPDTRFDVDNGLTLCADCHTAHHQHLSLAS